MVRTIKQKSCARAWSDACSSIIDAGDEAYNVVIDVEDPLNRDAKDNQAIVLVDKFLRQHDQNPVVTVANTIFPQSLYEANGSPAFYDVYHRDFDRFSQKSKTWGQYFDRMTRYKVAGKNKIPQLQDLISKMKGKNARYRAIYELAIFNPATDRRRSRGGPCLSHLSFKRDPNLGLLLTAIYRNHYYVTRLLGNLIGLGRLQAFVAKEAGLGLGSLTVISTHAEMDTNRGWKITDARDLVMQAATLLRD